MKVRFEFSFPHYRVPTSESEKVRWKVRRYEGGVRKYHNPKWMRAKMRFHGQTVWLNRRLDLIKSCNPVAGGTNSVNPHNSQHSSCPCQSLWAIQRWEKQNPWPVCIRKNTTTVCPHTTYAALYIASTFLSAHPYSHDADNAPLYDWVYKEHILCRQWVKNKYKERYR